jgi:hypothetical protein
MLTYADVCSGTEMQHVAYDYAARLAAGAAIADLATAKGLLLQVYQAFSY